MSSIVRYLPNILFKSLIYPHYYCIFIKGSVKDPDPQDQDHQDQDPQDQIFWRSKDLDPAVKISGSGCEGRKINEKQYKIGLLFI